MSNVRRPGESHNDTIDRLLRERRPDRFVMSGDPDERDLDRNETIGAEWLDQIARDIEAELTADELPQVLLKSVRADVNAREGAALKIVNRELRQYHQSGQWPLFAIDEPAMNGHLLDLPLGVVSRSQYRGEQAKVLKEHVAFRAVTSDDLRKFAQEERRRAANEFESRNQSCAGAESLADELDLAGAVTFGEWWQRPPESLDEDDS
jgi:hypothetical protein